MNSRCWLLAVLVGMLTTACCPLTKSMVIFEISIGSGLPLYVCCGPGDVGCVGVELLSDPACDGATYYTCEQGETTTIDGRPAVICHD